MIFKNDFCFLESLVQEPGNRTFFSTFFWFLSTVLLVLFKKQSPGTQEQVKAFKVLKEYMTRSCSGPLGAQKTKKGQQAEPTL